MCRKVVFFLFTLFFINSFAQFAGGSGTFEDPWLIRTPENLDSIRYFSGHNYFKQIADIDLGIAPWNAGEGWDPIRNDSYVFDGAYDGSGKMIKNLYINKPDSSFIGLFRRLNNSLLHNIKLSNVNITGYRYVGSLSGHSYSSEIESVCTSGTVNGTSYAGGLMGTANLTTVNNCYTATDVSGTYRTGGFIGAYITIRNAIYLNNSYSIGKVTGEGSEIGGFIGDGVSSYIRFCYWNTQTSTQSSSDGGEGRTTEKMTYSFPDSTYENWDFDNIWAEDLDSLNNGYPYFQTDIPVTTPSKPSNLSVTPRVGGIITDISWNNPDSLINGDPLTELNSIYLYRNFEIIQTYKNPTPGEYISFVDTVATFDDYVYKVVAENSNGLGKVARYNISIGGLFAGGSGTELDPYQVSTAGHLYNIRNFLGPENADKYFKQVEVIDLGVAPWNEGAGWIPIGNDDNKFMGDYKGFIWEYQNGEYYYVTYVPNIVNLTINDSLLNYASLFGVITDADICNVYLENVNITGHSGCGALAGTSITSNITGCFSRSGTIFGTENEIGGLIGASIRDSISCCYSMSDVSGLDHIGGLVGLVFENTTFTDCYAQGNVSGNNIVGGFVGAIDNSVIKNCYSSASVIGNSITGGLTASGTANTAVNSYWDIESSGQTTSGCGEGRTTYEMSVQYSDSIYVGWDFSNIWDTESYHSGWGYPDFQWDFYSLSIEDNSSSIPNDFVLSQNYPNPFNPTTKISYSVPQGFSGDVKLSVYNANGQLVKELVNEKKSSGMYSVEFNAADLNSGLYIYRLETTSSTLSKKMILLK